MIVVGFHRHRRGRDENQGMRTPFTHCLLKSRNTIEKFLGGFSGKDFDWRGEKESTQASVTSYIQYCEADMYLLLFVLFRVVTAADPVEVFMKGDNVTGDPRFYYCFRIPQLLVLPTGTLLAFAEGRADGCRPDVNRNRPIVVRASHDEGKTWGPIRIAGPALPSVGTNYPGAFVRDNSTVVLRYGLSNGSVFSTESNDEGQTWSTPIEASQPAGVRCGSAWPKPFGNNVVMACAGGSARSSDGGRTWQVSSKKVSLDPNVTGLGESMVTADGRSNQSLSMFIRAGSHNGWLTHAIAQSDDMGDTWGPARLLPIVGATCEGSIGRDTSAPPGQVLLASVSGRVPFRLGRGNMSVWTLDTAAAGSEPVSRLQVWPNAAGYSDFAQAKSGAMLLLFEGGGSVYDYGIKLSPIVI